MKIRIELEEEQEETEVVIRCNTLTPEVVALQQQIEAFTRDNIKQLLLHKGDTEYYVALDDILFFETDSKIIQVHTVDNVYETKYKLYELEEILPGRFLRISKSGIVNCDKIYSISRNLTSSSLIEFSGTHKQIFVSRSYYKVLKNKLEEKRLGL